ncbi:MAG: YegP family protein [Oceanospirillales bacterium]|nr:YegP family protein [Oceanospirillales bacterium]
MAGKYELKKGDTGKFTFNLKAANGQVILTSQHYESKASALNGIASVQTNGPLEERYDRRESKKGEPYFVLKAGNAQIIGTSEMYSSPAAMENGIASVKTNSPSEKIDDLTD